MSTQEKKDFPFYIELVLVTAVALAVANVWVNLILKVMKRMFPDSLWMEGVFAAVITAIAIYGLHKVFGEKTSKKFKDVDSAILPTGTTGADGYRPRVEGYRQPPQRHADYELL